MEKIKVFLASSSELEKDRADFETFIGRQNKVLIDQNVFIELIIWEDFIDTISKTRLQDEYNKAIEKSDIFIMLFFTKVGMYTKKEFLTAYNRFKRHGKPLIYTYFKNAEINSGTLNRNNAISLWDFQDKLKELGHFVTNYDSVDSLKFHFQSQLQKLDYLKKDEIDTSNIVTTSKKNQSVHIKFLNDLHPSDISIKKLTTVNLDAIEILIKWPKVLSESFENMKGLIQDAEEFDDPNSTFYGCEEAAVNSFYDSALSSRKSIIKILENAPKRVKKLVKGMNGYWGTFSNYSKQIDSIRNYLILTNLEMQARLAYTLSHIWIKEKFFPSEFGQIMEYNEKKENAIQRIFSLDEEVFWADVSYVSKNYINSYIWGKKGHIIQAYNTPDGKAVISPWFANYVIPQIEFILTEAPSDTIIQYRELIEIRKIRDNNFVEYYGESH